jgi:hypothetical protein
MKAVQYISNMQYAAKRRSRTRPVSGSSFVELTVAVAIITAMTIFAVDICLVMVAYGVNDRACRDAARAAAQGADKSQALNLAKAATDMHDFLSNVIDEPAIDESTFTYQTSPATGQPHVTVTTRTTVKVPAPVFLMGAKISDDQISVASQYTFPIVNLDLETSS